MMGFFFLGMGGLVLFEQVFFAVVGWADKTGKKVSVKKAIMSSTNNQSSFTQLQEKLNSVAAGTNSYPLINNNNNNSSNLAAVKKDVVEDVPLIMTAVTAASLAAAAAAARTTGINLSSHRTPVDT